MVHSRHYKIKKDNTEEFQLLIASYEQQMWGLSSVTDWRAYKYIKQHPAQDVRREVTRRKCSRHLLKTG
jgi:hypothetical protein